MPIVYLAVKSLRFVKFVRHPLFRDPLIWSPAQRRAITKIWVKEAAAGTAVRAGALFTLGLVVDPFNNFVVPASQGLLITSDKAAGNILHLDFRDPRTFATAVIGTPDVAIDMGIDIVQKGWQLGEMIVAEAKGAIEVVGGKLEDFKDRTKELLDFS